MSLTMFVTFLIGTLFRSASLYHPQRRAILHLKTQRKKIREKGGHRDRPSFIDFSPLKAKSLKIVMLSLAISSFGYLSPIFYLVSLIMKRRL